jgi:hypothetical protein
VCERDGFSRAAILGNKEPHTRHLAAMLFRYARPAHRSAAHRRSCAPTMRLGTLSSNEVGLMFPMNEEALTILGPPVNPAVDYGSRQTEASESVVEFDCLRTEYSSGP